MAEWLDLCLHLAFRCDLNNTKLQFFHWIFFQVAPVHNTGDSSTTTSCTHINNISRLFFGWLTKADGSRRQHVAARRVIGTEIAATHNGPSPTFRSADQLTGGHATRISPAKPKHKTRAPSRVTAQPRIPFCMSFTPVNCGVSCSAIQSQGERERAGLRESGWKRERE